MSRTTLPNRRELRSMPVVWETETGDHAFDISAGYYLDGRVAEVFYSGGMKSGSGLAHAIQDACVVLSIAFQHGVPVAAFLPALGTVPVHGGVAMASPIGAIVAALGAQ
jgi:hypothetical protein